MSLSRFRRQEGYKRATIKDCPYKPLYYVGAIPCGCPTRYGIEGIALTDLFSTTLKT